MALSSRLAGWLACRRWVRMALPAWPARGSWREDVRRDRVRRPTPGGNHGQGQQQPEERDEEAEEGRNEGRAQGRKEEIAVRPVGSDPSITLRALRWPEDRCPLESLDTSFVTDRVFCVGVTRRSHELAEIVADPPLEKAYPIADHLEEIAAAHWSRVALIDDEIVGLVAMSLSQWNRRAQIEHLYVARSARNNGVGTALMQAALDEARRREARCLFVETQTNNYPAIQFYERSGFAWCGLDLSLYDPDAVRAGEVAVFFARDVK
jgi:ribosomal protein S18 acetylase RimI-like enzyme